MRRAEGALTPSLSLSDDDDDNDNDSAVAIQSSTQALIALARLYKGVAPKESLHVQSFSEIADFLARDTKRIPAARIGSIIWALGAFKISKPQVSRHQKSWSRG